MPAGHGIELGAGVIAPRLSEEAWSVKRSCKWQWVDGGLGRLCGGRWWSRPGDRRGRFAGVGGCWGYRFAEGVATSAGGTIRSGSG